MNDSYFKDPEFFYQLFDKETWKNTDKIVAKLYFEFFQKTAMDTGDWYESMIGDSKSFRRFSEEQDLIAIRDAFIGSGHMCVNFLLPIKTIDIADDFIKVELSQPKNVYQRRDYNYHQDIKNCQSFFFVSSFPGPEKRLLEKCLNINILSKKKNLSFDLDELENKCRQSRDIQYFEDHYREDNNFNYIFEYWEENFDSSEWVYVPYDEMSVHYTKYSIPNNDHLFKEHFKEITNGNHYPKEWGISSETLVIQQKKRNLKNE